MCIFSLEYVDYEYIVWLFTALQNIYEIALQHLGVLIQR